MPLTDITPQQVVNNAKSFGLELTIKQAENLIEKHEQHKKDVLSLNIQWQPIDTKRLKWVQYFDYKVKVKG